jgi:hypothetical protein
VTSAVSTGEARFLQSAAASPRRHGRPQDGVVGYQQLLRRYDQEHVSRLGAGIIASGHWSCFGLALADRRTVAIPY